MARTLSTPRSPKTAPHFFVDSLAPAGTLLLSEGDSRHALRSLRLRPGETVTLSDGRGTSGRGRMLGEDGGLAVISVEEVWPDPARGPTVSLALAPPKGERLSWAIQKLGELGVHETLLIRTERSVREWDSERSGRAIERLRAIAREAAMQSRRPTIMGVGGPVRLAAVLDAKAVMLSPSAAAPLAHVLADDAGKVCLVVGPEGGFTEAEQDQAARAGARVASLGSNILRTETAALVAATLVLARYGRLG